ncbi:SapC family protein [Sandaracinobacteroides saxicola]|uniref:SapC family protein n=1 Tax=Sandaracinobacteroides saxicola TaxID=2759707 RepID=A0A7G5IMJ3_9SPHN|nr:SapC family protein [Sandaracinobacteroides saxicola]QMW24585.1 SapC family protein [Sandaracinobacteroides saxicola]
MASQPPAQQLPLFYGSLAPLDTQAHAGWGLKNRLDLGFTRGTHAIPLTVDEFAMAQKHYPIVFGTGDGAVPLALVGLQEGVNQFVDAEGQWKAGTYIPAYVRRHPFMLAKLTPDATQLSLVFDDASGMLGPDEEQKLFDGAEPSEVTKNVLNFCEQFEQAIARTKSFMDELEKLGLLMEGEAQIQNPGMEQPAVFRGFRMVDETKLQNIRGDQARKMVQNGMMGLLYAHLFSLAEMRSLFEAQAGQL